MYLPSPDIGFCGISYLEAITLMNPTSVSRAEGPGRAVVRDQLDLQESRLWDRARLNLMLLYGGRRGGGVGGQIGASSVSTSSFGPVDLEI